MFLQTQILPKCCALVVYLLIPFRLLKELFYWLYIKHDSSLGPSRKPNCRTRNAVFKFYTQSVKRINKLKKCKQNNCENAAISWKWRKWLEFVTSCEYKRHQDKRRSTSVIYIAHKRSWLYHCGYTLNLLSTPKIYCALAKWLLISSQGAWGISLVVCFQTSYLDEFFRKNARIV